jgi:CheY-like chemotaxis protein
MVEAYGWNLSLEKVLLFILQFQQERREIMNNLNGKPIEILLVEDNPGDVRLTREALKDSKLNNNLHVVNDGLEALAFLRKEGKYINAPRPDLILLDLNLPKKNGRDVLTEIKEDPDLKRIPVVILTTSSAEEDIIKSYNSHANCYITKPVDFEQFIKVVKKIEDFWFTIVKLPKG